MLKSAGADINALTYEWGARLALLYPQKAIKTDMIVRTPMLLASKSYYVTYTTLSNAFDTLRLLTDSMDFLDADASGWRVLSNLGFGTGHSGGEIGAKSALLLWMLKLVTFEMKAYYNRSELAFLLYCTLNPYSGLEQASNLLLNLGDADVIDVSPYATDGYTILHWNVTCAQDPEFVSIVLAKGPNLHLQRFDEWFTPEKESLMSVAMYSSWAFADWLHGLVGIEVDLRTFIDQELESNAFVHPGWDKETLHDLFDYPARSDIFLRNLPSCDDCHKSIPIMRVQPYWRHLLERIKQRIDPDNPFRSDPVVDETKISNIRSETEASNDPDHEPDSSGSVSLEFNDDVGSEAEFGLKVHVGYDVHGYPENVSIQSDCVYDEKEVVCMDCWLHYRRTGTRFEVEDSLIDEHSSSEEESSDDEFSPYLIHS